MKLSVDLPFSLLKRDGRRLSHLQALRICSVHHLMRRKIFGEDADKIPVQNSEFFVFDRDEPRAHSFISHILSCSQSDSIIHSIARPQIRTKNGCRVQEFPLVV